jgi:hypothetical protein
MVLYQICVVGADLKSNMAARVHNVFSKTIFRKKFQMIILMGTVYVDQSD